MKKGNTTAQGTNNKQETKACETKGAVEEIEYGGQHKIPKGGRNKR